MTTSYSWRYVLDDLGARYRLILPDLPGNGRSGVPARRFDAAALASWLGEFQDALDLRGCEAVGNSLGGYLCMRHALADPTAFSRLVTIHAPAFPEPRLHALHTALSIPGADAAFGWWVRRDTTRWAHQVVHYYDETLKSLEEAREYGDPLRTPAGTQAFAGYLRDVMRPAGFAEFIASLKQLAAEGKPFPVPLMLVYSRQDRMVSPAVGAKLSALIQGARMEWLSHSSHFAQVDSPRAVSALLTDFLNHGCPEPRLS
jgi:pimeloyl-ACP methyl ester carboxylesterase